MHNTILRWRHIRRRIRFTGVLLKCERNMPHLMKGMEFEILVDRYDFVTPFGWANRYRQPPKPRYITTQSRTLPHSDLS